MDSLADPRTLVVPGQFFGAPEYVRVALGIDPAVLTRGLERIADALDASRASIVAKSPG